MKKTLINTCIISILLSLPGCGGGGGGSDESSSTLSNLIYDGSYVGSLELSGNTCESRLPVQNLPTEITLNSANLSSGPNYFLDILGDQKPEIEAYDDGNAGLTANTYSSPLNPFLTGYNCTEDIAISLTSAAKDKDNFVAAVTISRKSNIYCSNTRNALDSKFCNVYYGGTLIRKQ